VTIHNIDLCHVTHTCPADEQPHPIDIRRRVYHVTPGGPCRNPSTIRSGSTTAVIPCGRHEPTERQCAACRTVVIERTITTRHTGRTETDTPSVPSGLAPDPCQTCRHPLAAILATHGRHLLCPPPPRRTPHRSGT
jgi:hypothetical protein